MNNLYIGIKWLNSDKHMNQKVKVALNLSGEKHNR